MRPMENDVIGLPLARWTAGVHQRRILAVNRGGLAIGVGFIVEAIHHLHFVSRHQIDAGVSAVLSIGFGGIGRGPLDVKLAIAIAFPGLNAAFARDDLHVAVLYLPHRLAAFVA